MIDILEKKADLFLRATEASSVASVAFGDRLMSITASTMSSLWTTLADNVPAMNL